MAVAQGLAEPSKVVERSVLIADDTFEPIPRRLHTVAPVMECLHNVTRLTSSTLGRRPRIEGAVQMDRDTPGVERAVDAVLAGEPRCR